MYTSIGLFYFVFIMLIFHMKIRSSLIILQLFTFTCSVHIEMEIYYKEFYSSDPNYKFEADTDEDFIEAETYSNAYDYGTMDST